jgi:hypothetical protein
VPNSTRLKAIGNKIAVMMGLNPITTVFEYYAGWPFIARSPEMVSNVYTVKQCDLDQKGHLSVKLLKTTDAGPNERFQSQILNPTSDAPKPRKLTLKPKPAQPADSFLLSTHPTLVQSLYETASATNQNYAYNGDKKFTATLPPEVLAGIKRLFFQISTAEASLESRRIEFIKNAIGNAKVLYNLVDWDCDNQISIRDLMFFLKEHKVYTLNGDEDLKLLFGFLDRDRDGIVSFPEFIFALFGLTAENIYLLNCTYSNGGVNDEHFVFFLDLFKEELSSQNLIEVHKKDLWNLESFD